MRLRPAPISTKNFHWHADTRTFTAEASDLGNLRMERVWDDACDVGFTLVFEAAGHEIVFAMSHQERDQEGELLWEDYTPARRTSWTITVRIFND